MSTIISIELEKNVLAGLLSFPDKFAEVGNFLSERDFVGNSAHPIIFAIIKKRLESATSATPILVIEEINQLKLKFPEIENISSYILDGLALIQINRESLVDTVKELKKITVAREIYETAENIKNIAKNNLNLPTAELISKCDEKYNEKINSFYTDKQDVFSLFGDNLIERLEERRKNPIEEFGLMSPHKKLNELYGSLIRPGNITTICARSGSYKTTFLLHFGVGLCDLHNIPIIHLDFNEMTRSELEDRQIASLSGVPLHLVETGKFGMNEETLLKVRATYSKLKKFKYYYTQVGNKTSLQLINTIKRIYYSKVGRGNPTAIILDYWKSYGEGYNSSKAEWERMGKFTQDIKNCITDEIEVGVMAGLQGNRNAIVTGKSARDVIDDEGIASGGDRIIFHSSHFFILRRKTLDVIASENNKFGNCILKQVAKARHLGKNIKDAITPIKMADGSYQSNYIHFDIQNFNVVECGDLASTIAEINQLNIKDDKEEEDLSI